MPPTVILSGGNSLYFGEKRFGSGAFTFSKPFSDVSLPRLSFSLFTSYYQRGLLFIRSRGSIRLGYEVNYIYGMLFL